jgi:hypothetical protein
VDVGPEQESPAEPVRDDTHGPSSEAVARLEHRHAMDFAHLQSTGRFVRDSRLGGMFHAGKVSLREDSAKESLHVSLGQDHRVSIHVDRFSPLADRRAGRTRGYSARRVILHNVGIVVDYVILLFHRRFGEQRCELECEQVCDDEHDEEVAPPGVSPPPPSMELPLDPVRPRPGEEPTA